MAASDTKQLDTSDGIPLEFVVFTIYNTKERESFIFYLQWNGNEENLNRLEALIDNADFSCMDGDYIAIQLDTSVKIPESAVDIHCKVKKTLSRYVHLFTKCVGQLDFPFYRFEL